MRLPPSLLSSLLLSLTLSGCASSPKATLPQAPEAASGYRAGLVASEARRAMAAAANPLAAEAGREILLQGGSAIDAAIAMQAVLTLVEPQSSGIGGGAFLLYWDGRRVQAYDGRETAPAGATERLFLHADGTPMAFEEARIGGRSVGVPGVLRALELAHRDHGKLAWPTLFEPAIRLARDGFPLSPRLYNQLVQDPFLKQSPEMAALYLDAQGQVKPVGTRLRNPALADSLALIAREGAGALYRGELAQAIATAVQGSANPGSLSLADLARYRAKARAPLCTDYHRWRVCGMPPPAGGLTVAQTLGILQALEARDPAWALAPLRPVPTSLPAAQEPRPEAVHLIAEAERLAYADRAQYVADPEQVPVNVKGLLDPGYLASRAQQVGERSLGKATPGVPPGPTLAWAPDRSPLRISTSQVVAADAWGGALSMTTTVESYFGSHLMVQGFMLNNQLTDFSFLPREKGLPVANRVEPGKRPRSTMSPTLVFDRDSGELVAALGSPGGSQIAGYVVKTLVGLLDWQLDAQAAAGLPNFGSRNGPTELERGETTAGLRQALEARGHEVREDEMTSGIQVIRRVGSGWQGGADPRREGAALGD
ncbi:gamma-glutamyltransferase family protein [Pseudomonas oryzihabitans]|uniref:gamma-glutamyltransferase family protein n=1 Tax=Pseudomonas oryzihabitans TaxID=47885 RepID=UPI0011A861AE|nr:gamma-glutamyltransferase family protein [Pseudomonas psychrotolerans]